LDFALLSPVFWPCIMGEKLILQENGGGYKMSFWLHTARYSSPTASKGNQSCNAAGKARQLRQYTTRQPNFGSSANAWTREINLCRGSRGCTSAECPAAKLPEFIEAFLVGVWLMLGPGSARRIKRVHGVFPRLPRRYRRRRFNSFTSSI
jgi:hypothetical protein